MKTKIGEEATSLEGSLESIEKCVKLIEKNKKKCVK